MPAAAPGVYSLALVRVHELRAQKSFATRQFDDMDEWMEDQEELGLQQTLTKLQEPDESSRYAIVLNAYPGLRSSSSMSRPLARISPTYGALCSVAGVPDDSPSTDSDSSSSSSYSSSSSTSSKISKLWGKCKRKLRKLASKSRSTQQAFSPRSSSSSSTSLTSSAPSSRRSSSTSGSSFLSRRSSSSSGFSSSPASSVALDYPSPLHSVLSSSPGACLVPTPEALAQQAQHWQHALSAMAGLSRWFTG